jgi:hypothetical protein
MSNRKKLKGLRPSLIGIDEPTTGFAGRYNAYTCDTCEKAYLTLDLDNGVTPMFAPCFATQGCTGRAHSAMYPQGEPPPWIGEPIIHWVKPSKEEFMDLPASLRDHVRQGGLIRKATSATPEWVKPLL